MNKQKEDYRCIDNRDSKKVKDSQDVKERQNKNRRKCKRKRPAERLKDSKCHDCHVRKKECCLYRVVS